MLRKMNVKAHEEALLVEYQKAQDSAEFHERIAWQARSILWAANFGLSGYVATSGANKYVVSVLALLGSFLLIMQMLVWDKFLSRIKCDKYKRCQRIEKLFKMHNHRNTEKLWKKKRLQRSLWIIVCVLILLWIALAAYAWLGWPEAADGNTLIADHEIEASTHPAVGGELFVGVVENGRVRLLTLTDSLELEASLTSISMQESVPPEMGQLDLYQYEGDVLVIRGHDGGGWIYSATVVEVVTPLAARFILDIIPAVASPCEKCLERLNSATREDFEEITQIGPGISALLVAARPFVSSECRGAVDIERLLDDITGIGEVLPEKIVKHFCPELYE